MNKENNIDLDDAMIFLSGVDIFRNLGNEIIENMAQRMSISKFQANDYLIHKGDPGQHMLLIKRGKVSVMLGEKEIILGKGAVLGEMSLLSGKPRKADIIAQTDTEAFLLERDDFQKRYNA